MFTRTALGDGDGDGLPGWRELLGFRNSKGAVIVTDPTAFDSDGDGLGDAEEIGQRQMGSFTEHYDGQTDARNADTDGDGLSDGEEIEGITSPTLADSDGDTLTDSVEFANGFDPMQANPDRDGWGDATELQQGSDPFYYDITDWLTYSGYFLAGLGAGEAGISYLANYMMVQSIPYVAGTIISGLFFYGNIRDTVYNLFTGNLEGTLFSALGLVPILGDGTKIARLFGKCINRFPAMAARLLVGLPSNSKTLLLLRKYRRAALG